MTREEAIKYLTEEQKKTEEVVALTERDFGVSESVWHTEYEAFALAIAALREQEELARNLHDVTTACEWCFHFANDRQYLVSHGNGMYEEAMFEFCPMCGRRLEEL